MATRSRAAQPRKLPGGNKTNTKTLTPDTLADAFKSTLRITGSQKTKKTAETKPSPVDLMSRINAVSAKLSSLAKDESKASWNKAGETVEVLSKTCRDAFLELRQLNIKPIDVERSAASVAAKLVALGKVSGELYICVQS